MICILPETTFPAFGGDVQIVCMAYAFPKKEKWGGLESDLSLNPASATWPAV